MDATFNGPFRDGAPSLYDGAVRVPTIFRWPGKIKPSTESRELLSHLDVLPLCLAASGATPFKDRVLDGRDPLPALTGAAQSPHERLVFMVRNSAALRQGDLKIVRNTATDPWKLYDLARDPAESKDLAAERAADVARLDLQFQNWLADMKRDASSRRAGTRPVKPENFLRVCRECFGG